MAETRCDEVTFDHMDSMLWLLNIPREKYREYKAWHNRPKPTKVIINDPATVVFFNDGTKVVAKAKDGDEYDPLFGIMACALRKTGKNRVRIDEWEPVIDFLSSYIADAKECRAIADMLNTTADALELDGVMDAIEDFDEREYDPIAEMDRVVSEALERLEEILDEIGEEDG